MFHILQILTILLVTIALAPALAHALEFPGKKRLDRDAYVTVQPIYYPGFTVAGGIGEVGGLVAVILLLLLTPAGSLPFSLTLAALLGLAGMQVVYWLFTHPVNKYWLQSTKVGNFGAGFFGVSANQDQDAADWTKLRDRWEYSHIARAGLATLSFLALIVAMVIQEASVGRS